MVAAFFASSGSFDAIASSFLVMETTCFSTGSFTLNPAFFAFAERLLTFLSWDLAVFTIFFNNCVEVGNFPALIFSPTLFISFSARSIDFLRDSHTFFNSFNSFGWDPTFFFTYFIPPFSIDFSPYLLNPLIPLFVLIIDRASLRFCLCPFYMKRELFLLFLPLTIG